MPQEVAQSESLPAQAKSSNGWFDPTREQYTERRESVPLSDGRTFHMRSFTIDELRKANRACPDIPVADLIIALTATDPDGNTTLPPDLTAHAYLSSLDARLYQEISTAAQAMNNDVQIDYQEILKN